MNDRIPTSFDGDQGEVNGAIDVAYPVCILAAGRGTRSGRFGAHMHKALVPLGSKPVISWIVEAYPPDCDFVVALGFRSDQVREFLTIAYPERTFRFVEVDNWEHPGSGPGYSLNCCRPFLERPFVFTACDTVVPGAIPSLARNWVGVHQVEDPENWCSVSAGADWRISRIHFREAAATSLAFIGIAGIRDYLEFWHALECDRSITQGEYQVTNGLSGLLAHSLFAEPLPWYDTGTEANWRKAAAELGTGYNSLGKNVDTTFKVGGSIVKFFASAERAQRRAQRAVLMPGIVPPMQSAEGHFLKYQFVEGVPLAECMTQQIWCEFLEWCLRYLWVRVDEQPGAAGFAELASAFYREKTLTRVREFLGARDAEALEGPAVMDGELVSPVLEALAELDWTRVVDGQAVRFHGDLHPDNVLVREQEGEGRFVLIDWREDFGGSLTVGDMAYDLAKLRHTNLFTVHQMESGAFAIERDGGEGVTIRLSQDPAIAELDRLLGDFMRAHSVDTARVDLITSLVFLNMAPLYEDPLGEFLYWLGRRSLHRARAGHPLLPA